MAHKYPYHKERKVTIKPGDQAVIVSAYFKQWCFDAVLVLTTFDYGGGSKRFGTEKL